MKNRASSWKIGTAVILLSLTTGFTGHAEATALNSSSWGWHRGWGGQHCWHHRGWCPYGIAEGHVDPTFCETEEIANLDGEVFLNPGGVDQVHFIFRCYLDWPADSASVPLIPEEVVLTPEVASALGYDSVTLLPGLYPVDRSTYPEGEMYIDAILGQPTPTRILRWGAIKGIYR